MTKTEQTFGQTQLKLKRRDFHQIWNRKGHKFINTGLLAMPYILSIWQSQNFQNSMKLINLKWCKDDPQLFNNTKSINRE